MTIIIILALGIFIFYLFNNDKKDEKIKVLQRGGLNNVYPNFVQYANSLHLVDDSFFSITNAPLTLVKNDGEYLEYKFPVIHDGTSYGFYYIGIQHTFGAIAYCFCKNKFGRKIEGFMRELHNGRDNSYSRDRSIEDYTDIFWTLIKQMESIPNFEEKFYFNQ
jgi:hypothetical protein